MRRRKEKGGRIEGKKWKKRIVIYGTSTIVI